MMRIAGCFILFWALLGCRNDRVLKRVLKSKPILKEVASKKDSLRLQIIYTTIHKQKDGSTKFVTHTFHVDSNLYFYPASTAKLLVSAMALEKIEAETQADATYNTPLKAFAIGSCQTNEEFDTTAKNSTPTLGHYIHKMLLVSDNTAYNRVFDYVGQDQLQARLSQLGFSSARIIQRFDPTCNPEANRIHNRFEFYRPDSTFLFSSTAITKNIYTNPITNVAVGNAYYFGDSLVKQPRQFRYNNNLPLAVLNQSLMRLMYPGAFDAAQHFHLNTSDLQFLKTQLGMYPYESDYHKYDSSYFPAYKKYLYYGKDPKAVIDSNLRIYNIVGQAYGFTTDIAYFEDTKNDISFFLAVSLYTNADGILNDDKYEYNTIAFPFLQALGEAVYQRELKQHKN